MFYSRSELENMKFKSLGDNVLIDKRTPIDFPNKISIGNNVTIGSFCILSGNIILHDYVRIASYVFLSGNEVGIIVKNFCCIGPGTKILTGTDDYSGEYMSSPFVDSCFQNPIYKKIILEKQSIIGGECLILPGAYVAEGVAIGGMSMLKDVTEPYKIYAGVPAKNIKERSKKMLILEKKFLSLKKG